jgi:glycosyltransferase involved in cell wall biosynthesis
MKLLIVTHEVGKGNGQGRVNYEVVLAALEAGHSVTLLASAVDPALELHPLVTSVIVPISRVPSRLLKYQVFAWRAGAWIRAHRKEFDVVQVNGFIAWADADANAVHFAHTGWYNCGFYPFRVTTGLKAAYQVIFTKLNCWCEQWAFRHSSVLIPVSAKVGVELQRVGVPASRIRVIHNGVDIEEFYPSPQKLALREKFGLPTDAFMLLFAGDLTIARKNLGSVLEAMVDCPAHVHLTVAGDAITTPYPAMAARLGLENRVHFIGMCRQMPDLMRACDTFAFPSRYEAMSLVLLEALASGLPIVTAHSSGGAEVIDARSGVVLDSPDDVRGIATAITALATDPAHAASMGQAARDLACTLSWQIMGRKYMDLFEEIAGNRASTSGTGQFGRGPLKVQV